MIFITKIRMMTNIVEQNLNFDTSKGFMMSKRAEHGRIWTTHPHHKLRVFT